MCTTKYLKDIYMKQALLTNKELVLQLPHKVIDEHTIVFKGRDDEYFVDEGKPYLNDLDFHLEDRSTCETDISKLQLIPYITVVDKETKKFFTYKRGKQGDEGRLHDLYSIGLGGHIEKAPSNLDNISLFDVVTENILTELNEEAGIEPTKELQDTILTKLLHDEFMLIYSTKSPVEEVHLALWICIELNSEQLTQFEEGNILEPKWYSVEEFDTVLAITESRLENWSDVCYKELKKDLNK